MGNKHKKTEETKSRNKSLKTLLLFCSVVGVCILLSLSVRFIILLQKSAFDGTHRFTLAVQTAPEQFTILSFDPTNKTITDIAVTGKSDLSSLQRDLGILIDGTVLEHQPILFDANVGGGLFSLIFHPMAYETQLTWIDLLRLGLFANSVQGTDITHEKLSVGEDPISENKIISTTLLDDTVSSENISIQIINATDVSGLGSRLERIIDTMGGNVVAVNTATQIAQTSSLVYYGEPSYTVTKLHKLITIPPTNTTEQGIGDIIITIGEDQAHTHAF